MFKCITISLTQPTHSISEDDNYNMHERNVRKLKDFDQTPTGNTQAANYLTHSNGKTNSQIC